MIHDKHTGCTAPSAITPPNNTLQTELEEAPYFPPTLKLQECGGQEIKNKHLEDTKTKSEKSISGAPGGGGGKVQRQTPMAGTGFVLKAKTLYEHNENNKPTSSPPLTTFYISSFTFYCNSSSHNVTLTDLYLLFSILSLPFFSLHSLCSQ